jgi:hypothetical protein
MELTMPGPKPSPAIAFRDLYHAIAKLRAASETTAQETIIVNLIAGLRRCEPQWNVTRLPSGAIDISRQLTDPSYRNPAINPEG